MKKKAGKARMGRPPKKPEDRRTGKMEIPVTAAEKEEITSAAEADGQKPVTWSRNVLLRVARGNVKK